MKKILATIILASSVLLSGCAPQKNGVCATQAHGYCLLTWIDGKKVPSGEIDVRYAGMKEQGNAADPNFKTAKPVVFFSGSTTVSGKNWVLDEKGNRIDD
ncbi:hypothetical protein [Citrobacter sp. Igbk 16]|uniref:hypothetical protein n=1 Tax=Citrobacter sp. Igbk 16 TaxID=2963958 RepID=UPI00230435A6|nr:hypothetical protein [Citrobacter sp. Igbk 16]MDA8518979.1 hypothetical protein [Citrobacter sp. Igbk 16]